MILCLLLLESESAFCSFLFIFFYFQTAFSFLALLGIMARFLGADRIPNLGCTLCFLCLIDGESFSNILTCVALVV